MPVFGACGAEHLVPPTTTEQHRSGEDLEQQGARAYWSPTVARGEALAGAARLAVLGLRRSCSVEACGPTRCTRGAGPASGTRATAAALTALAAVVVNEPVAVVVDTVTELGAGRNAHASVALRIASGC